LVDLVPKKTRKLARSNILGFLVDASTAGLAQGLHRGHLWDFSTPGLVEDRLRSEKFCFFWGGIKLLVFPTFGL